MRVLEKVQHRAEGLLNAHDAAAGWTSAPDCAQLQIPAGAYSASSDRKAFRTAPRAPLMEPGSMNYNLAQQLLFQEQTGVAVDESAIRNRGTVAVRSQLDNRHIEYDLLHERNPLTQVGRTAGGFDTVFLGTPNVKTVFNTKPYLGTNLAIAGGVTNQQHVERLAHARAHSKRMKSEARKTARGVAAQAAAGAQMIDDRRQAVRGAVGAEHAHVRAAFPGMAHAVASEFGLAADGSNGGSGNANLNGANPGNGNPGNGNAGNGNPGNGNSNGSSRNGDDGRSTGGHELVSYVRDHPLQVTVGGAIAVAVLAALIKN